MGTIIDIVRKTKVESPVYGDSLVVLRNGVELYSCVCSTHPNPFQPTTKKAWVDVYADLAEQECGWQFVQKHIKYGRCILLNGGAELKTINPNINHGGKYIATGVFIHRGNSLTWRGSRGCITVPPTEQLFSIFKTNETGKLILRKAV